MLALIPLVFGRISFTHSLCFQYFLIFMEQIYPNFKLLEFLRYFFIIFFDQLQLEHINSGAHLKGWGRGARGVRTPSLFRCSPTCALKFLNQFRRNALKNQFKKRKNPLKRCTNSILLKFFNAILRSILKRGSHQ